MTPLARRFCAAVSLLVPAVGAAAPSADRPPRAVAVVVGISDYPRGAGGAPVPASDGAARDAHRFAEWLRSEGGWSPADVLLMTDSGGPPRADPDDPGDVLPTRENLRAFATGRWLDARLGPGAGGDDLVVIYFAGQAVSLAENRGGVKADRGYLMALDGPWAVDEAVDALAARGVPVLCLLDTSLDGRPKPVPGGTAGASGRSFLQRLTRRAGVSAWLASASGPAAVAPRFQERSPFTAALLRSLGRPSGRNNLVSCLRQMGSDPGLAGQNFAASGNLPPRLTLWARDARKGGHPTDLLLQRGHSDGVTHLVYTPAGDTLYTAGRDSTVRAWRLADRTLLRVLAPHSLGVTALAVRGDGRVVVAGDGGGAVRAWDPEHRTTLPAAHPAEAGACEDAAFVAGSPRYVTRDADGRCHLWSPEGGAHVPRTVAASALALAAAPGEGGPVGFVAAGPRDATASRLFRFRADGTPLDPVDGPGGRVKSPALATDGRRTVAGDADGRLLLRDEAAGRVLPLPKVGSAVVSVALAGGRLAVAERTAIHLFDPAVGAGRGVLALEPGVRIFRLALSPDGRRLAALVDAAPGVRVWSFDPGGKALAVPLAPEGPTAVGLAFAPDGETLAAGCQDGSVRTWALGSGDPGLNLPRGRGRVAALGSGGDGRYLLQVTSDGYAFAWDLQEGGAPRPLRRADAGRARGEWLAQSGALAADGKTAYLTHEGRGDVVAFDLATGEPLPGALAAPEGLTRVRRMGRAVAAGGPGPGSGRVAAAARGRAAACVWDARGKPFRVLAEVFDPRTFGRQLDLADLDLAADGKTLLAVGGSGAVGVFDLEASDPADPLRPVLSASLKGPDFLKPNEAVVAARFVPGSVNTPARVALALADLRARGGVQSRVVLWTPGGPAPAPLADRIGGKVSALAVSADGRWLTVGADLTIDVWDLRAARPRPVRLAPRPNHLERVQALVVRSDPPMVVSGGDDTQVRFWPLGGARPNELLGSVALDQNTGAWVAYTARLDAPRPAGSAPRKFVRFDSSLGGEIGVTWIDGDEVRSLEQFGQESRLLALTDFLRRGEAPSPPEGAPTRDAEPPRVVIEDPGRRVTGEAETRLTLSLGARPLQELRLYQNAVPVVLDPADWKGRAEVTVPVKLVKGKNAFYAMASAADAIDGRSNEVDLVYHGPEDEPKLHILALGVGRYDAPAMALRFAVKDARDFAEHLRGRSPDLPTRAGYFRVLTDDEVTESALDAEFLRLEKAVRGRPQDRVVLFVAGHTDVEGRVFSLLLPPFPGAGRARGTRLPLAMLYRNLTRLAALHRAVVVDACRTQEIARDPRLRQLRNLVNEKAHGARTTYILAARRAGQLVGEVDALEHGVLTYVLLRGLDAPGLTSPPEARDLAGSKTGADLDGDGVVTADELGRFADAHVPKLVTRFPHLVQRSGPGGLRPSRDDRNADADDPAAASFPIFRFAPPTEAKVSGR